MTIGDAGGVIISAIGMYLALIIFTRLSGLRSFSKISSFDFATTVAFGSVLASAVLANDPPVLQAIFALGVIYLLQHLVSRLRIHLKSVSEAVDNPPILVMNGSTILHDNLSEVGVTEKDLLAKLREANIVRWEQVRAVVVESTGDLSVLHDTPDAPPLEESLLSGVRDAERLKQ